MTSAQAAAGSLTSRSSFIALGVVLMGFCLDSDIFKG